MTNEKAIMCLEDMKIKVPIPKAAKQARENNEALDVAIKALQSAQPKTNYSESPNTSDCISRQAAIDAFNTNLNELVVGGEENAKTVENYLNRVLDKIKCLPSALGTNLAEVGTDCISRQQAIGAIEHITTSMSICVNSDECHGMKRMQRQAVIELANMPTIQPKRGKWILDRSGAYCCSKCMEPCAGYVMMKPRDKFCKMCGSRNEVTE